MMIIIMLGLVTVQFQLYRAIADAVRNVSPRVPPANLYSDTLLLSGI